MTTAQMTGGDAAPGLQGRATTVVRHITLPWHRLVLGGILALAAFLNFFQLSRNGYANSFYAAAVKSMSLNWHNFFFTSFDPAGFVTIDKPPLGFWIQVASVKLFGFSGASILWPEALAGVLSVALLYHLVQRIFGRAAGLLSALMLALTPVAVSDSRNNTIDSILVLFMLLGAWAVSRAVEPRRGGAARAHGLRWLLLCAVLVGLGFNIKMLEAYLVVPAFALVYLLGAQARWRTRLMHLALATVVMLAVSLSWALAVDMTPASQRPWVDSTTTNSEIDLAIGYNGLQRLLGQAGFPGGTAPGRGGTVATTSAFKLVGTITPLTTTSTKAATGTLGTGPASQTITRTAILAGQAGSANAQPGQGGGQGGPGGGGGGLFDNGTAGPFRLLESALGSQVGWLLPLAVIGLLVAGSRRVHFPLDRKQQGLVLWGAWLITMAGFYSVAGFFHSYYVVTMAPAIAALAGIAIVTLWQEYVRRPARRQWRGWILPMALLATAIAQVHMLASYPDWSRWVSPLVLGPTVVAVLVLVVARLRPRRAFRLWTPVALAIATLSLLVAPAVWAAYTTATVGSSIPSAGPSAQSGNGFGGPAGFQGAGGFGGQPPTGAGPGQIATGTGSGHSSVGTGFGQPPTGAAAGQAPANAGGNGGGEGTDAQVLAYLEQHQGSTYYLLVTTDSNSAAPYIIQTGKPVMSLGGFGGGDPILTVAQFQALVKNNTVRYVLSGGGGPGGSNAVMQWVQTSCKAVSASALQGTSAASTATGSTHSATGFSRTTALYDCAGA